MRRIQVITQKELVHPEELIGCTVIVVDVFLATSTIVFLLKNNYEPIYTVDQIEQANELSKQLDVSHLKLGEQGGHAVAGFMHLDPMLIKETEIKKPAIICSTNGTRAIEQARESNELYLSSLVNGHRVAKHIHQLDSQASIVIICSGNHDRFSLEDFVGAGHVIHHLIHQSEYDLSDSAKMAYQAFVQSKFQSFENLLQGETSMLIKGFGYSHALKFVLDHFEKVNVLPQMIDKKIIDANKTPREVEKN